jgi:hypothetical protein
MITVSLCGGLGNQLFQLAALDTISKQTETTPFLESESTTPTYHSQQDYFKTIFLGVRKNFTQLNSEVKTIYEPSYQFRNWEFDSPFVKINGFFQNYQYISNEFVQSLWFPNSPSLEGAFLHIRGGDYVDHPLHDVKLTEYYTRAIELFPKGTPFYVFTNDIPYAKTFPFLDTILHTFVDEPNEVVALSLMKNCTLGGICANSTFSWWGAFLNRNRTLVLPSKWFNDPNFYIDGYFFPEAIKCLV